MGADLGQLQREGQNNNNLHPFILEKLDFLWETGKEWQAGLGFKQPLGVLLEGYHAANQVFSSCLLDQLGQQVFMTQVNSVKDPDG
jgi:hypothetical protein